MGIRSYLFSQASHVNQTLFHTASVAKKIDTNIKLADQVFPTLVGSAGLSRGAYDACHSIACQDHICFVISCFRIGGDVIQVVRSFTPYSVVTFKVGALVSWSCKGFVRLCQGKLVPWHTLC